MSAMSSLIVARMSVRAEDRHVSEEYYAGLKPHLERVEGFHGLGWYRHFRFTDEHLALYSYEDTAAADRGLAALADYRFHAETVSRASVPDVMRLEMQGRVGEPVLSAPVGSYLSFSIRFAHPGYGDVLARDLGDVFTEISLIDGFIGAEYGQNDTLPDELVGLAAWQGAESFHASVPAGVIRDVRLYRRL
jgi:heme-degrading monooxygenase HmoA